MCVTKSPSGDRKNAFIMELLSQIIYWIAYAVFVGGVLVLFLGQMISDTREMYRELFPKEDNLKKEREETL